MTMNRILHAGLVSVIASVIALQGAVPVMAMTAEEEAAAIKRIENSLDNIRLAPSTGLSSAAASSGSGGDSTTTAPTADDLEAYAKRVFELVNKERKDAGLDTVVWDSDFAVCAQIRADELQYKYSHTRPVEPVDNTTDWPMNINGKGVYNAPSVADEQGVPHTWIGEAIVAQRETPQLAVTAWMDSAGHRRNLLQADHTRCGVGVYYTEEKAPSGYNWYWVIWFDNY